MSTNVIKLDLNTYCVDGYDLKKPERTGVYILDERPNGDVTIIETGPSISIPYIKAGLTKLNIQLNEVKHIIVTHIHLDHAGGAGLLLKECPNAKVIVHPKGKRHLNDPTRLIQGAKAVYGDTFSELFDPVVPIPNDALIEKNDQSTLQIHSERTLVFYDTPGHAKHHLSIYDKKTSTFFTGDTIGIRYPELARRNIPFYLPSTSPNQFNPEHMLQSLNLIESIGPKQIAFGHFGVSTEPAEVYRNLRKWIPIFINKGKEVISHQGNWQALKDQLMNEIKGKLNYYYNIANDDAVYESIQLDVTISAMGVIDYLTKQTT